VVLGGHRTVMRVADLLNLAALVDRLLQGKAAGTAPKPVR
jgi:hypothetical protein